MTAKTAAAAALGIGGLLLGLGVLAWEGGLFVAPSAQVALADATPVMLDTVAIRGRRVEASLNGRVTRVGSRGRVRLAVADGAVRLRFDGAPGVEVGDRLLAVGRVRESWRARRYVEVESWSVLRLHVRPPAAPGL